MKILHENISPTWKVQCGTNGIVKELWYSYSLHSLPFFLWNQKGERGVSPSQNKLCLPQFKLEMIPNGENKSRFKWYSIFPMLFSLKGFFMYTSFLLHLKVLFRPSKIISSWYEHMRVFTNLSSHFPICHFLNSLRHWLPSMIESLLVDFGEVKWSKFSLQ